MLSNGTASALLCMKYIYVSKEERIHIELRKEGKRTFANFLAKNTLYLEKIIRSLKWYTWHIGISVIMISI